MEKEEKVKHKSIYVRSLTIFLNDGKQVLIADYMHALLKLFYTKYVYQV